MAANHKDICSGENFFFFKFFLNLGMRQLPMFIIHLNNATTKKKDCGEV